MHLSVPISSNRELADVSVAFLDQRCVFQDLECPLTDSRRESLTNTYELDLRIFCPQVVARSLRKQNQIVESSYNYEKPLSCSFLYLFIDLVTVLNYNMLKRLRVIL